MRGFYRPFISCIPQSYCCFLSNLFSHTSTHSAILQHLSLLSDFRRLPAQTKIKYSYLQSHSPPFTCELSSRPSILPKSLLRTQVYISVVFGHFCPNDSWIYCRFVPLPSRYVAKMSYIINRSILLNVGFFADI